MVIDDFDFVRPVCIPPEADTPLIVNTNGMLAFAVPFESFETIAGWDSEMLEFGNGVDLSQFAEGCALNVGRKRAGFPFVKQESGLLASEGTDHRVRVIFNNAWR